MQKEAIGFLLKEDLLNEWRTETILTAAKIGTASQSQQSDIVFGSFRIVFRVDHSILDVKVLNWRSTVRSFAILFGAA